MTIKHTSFHSSKSELQERVASGSQDLDDYLGLADLLVREGNYGDAVQLLVSAVNLPVPNLQKARAGIELGWLIYDTDEPSKCLPIADRSIELIAEEVESLEVLFIRSRSLCLIAHCMWLSDPQAATEAAGTGLKLLEQLIGAAPDFDRIGLVYCEAARICNLLGRTERAIDLSMKCLELDLDKCDRLSCLVVYGEALRHEKQFSEAECNFKEALQNIEGDKGMLPRIYFELGLTYRDAGQYIEARETFVEACNALDSHAALRDDPRFLSDIHWNIAGLCYELADYDKAIKIFKDMLESYSLEDVNYWNALSWLGSCYEAKGFRNDALSYYDQVLASSHALDSDKESARQARERLRSR